MTLVERNLPKAPCGRQIRNTMRQRHESSTAERPKETLRKRLCGRLEAAIREKSMASPVHRNIPHRKSAKRFCGKEAKCAWRYRPSCCGGRYTRRECRGIGARE